MRQQKFTYHPSFAVANKQLQVTFTTNEYLQLIANYNIHTTPVLFPKWEPERYWAKLPWYIIARCPFCANVYTAAADTHGIYGWYTHVEYGRKVFDFDREKRNCSHWVNVQTFLNFNGNFPIEAEHITNKSGDTPIILRELFALDPTTCAVIHTLPICRVEDGRFVPRYSAYFITYYAEDGETTYDRRIRTCHGSFFHTAGFQRSDPQIADLPYWVSQGKLHWLDVTDPALPLCANDINRFPYIGIQGYGRGFVYSYRTKPDWPWSLFWQPEGHFSFELPL